MAILACGIASPASVQKLVAECHENRVRNRGEAWAGASLIPICQEDCKVRKNKGNRQERQAKNPVKKWLSPGFPWRSWRPWR